MKSDRVRMNFCQMYAATVGWRPPASVSADWSPCPRTDAGGNLRVAVGDALITTNFKFYLSKFVGILHTLNL